MKRLLLVLVLVAPNVWADTPTLNSQALSLNDANVTNHTVNLPGTVNAGELLVCYLGFDGGPTITWDNSSHGTWTEYINGNNVGAVAFTVQAKVAAGTEGGGTLTVTTDVVERSVGRCFAIGTWEGTLSGGFNCPAASTGDSNTPDPPAATDSWGSVDRKTIAVGVWDFPRTVSSYPTDYTLNQQNDNTAHNGSGTAARDQTSAGSQNPGTFTISAADQWMAATASVRGSAAAPPATPKNLMLMGVGQ